MDICYGIIIPLEEFWEIISNKRYGKVDLERLVQDFWDEADPEDRDTYLYEADMDEEEFLQDPTNFFNVMSYPEIEGLEIILLTRTSTSVFLGIVQEKVSPGLKAVPGFSSQRLHTVEQTLRENLFLSPAPRIYISRDIAWDAPPYAPEFP